MMSFKIKIKKDQVQKLALSTIGFFILLYVYFNFFLGPLNRSRDAMVLEIDDRQRKLSDSKNEITKAANLEHQAAKATARFAALKALSPEGAPIAWFPPHIKAFFANQQIDKAFARMESNTAFKQPELSSWNNYTWIIDLPQADFDTLGTAIAKLENTEPLLSVTKIKIQTVADQPEFQQVTLTAATIIQKR